MMKDFIENNIETIIATFVSVAIVAVVIIIGLLCGNTPKCDICGNEKVIVGSHIESRYDMNRGVYAVSVNEYACENCVE